MSFFKDFKDDLSQAVNELMPDEGTVPAAAPQMVDTISEPAARPSQDDLADLLKSLDAEVSVNAPQAEPMFETAAASTHLAEEPVEVQTAAAPVQEDRPVNIPVYTETPAAPAPAAQAAPVAPVFAPEPPKAEAPKEPVAPVFAPEPPRVEAPKEPVAPVFAPEPPRVEAPKEPVEPVFAPEPPKAEVPKEPVMPVFSQEPHKASAPINTIAEGVNEVGVIPTGMTVTGNIVTNGSIDIMGTVKGNVTVAGKLNITGNIEGDSKAEEIFADGARIIGEIVSNGTVKVGQSTVIKGNLSATGAVIAGAVKGDIDVKGPVILDSTAIIMGNIKSKSIQINNGAAIEGLCSQCYAEVNPASFFTEG